MSNVIRFLSHVLLVLALMATRSPAVAAGKQWIGTWATAPQPAAPGPPQTYRNQTLRLIVHTSAGGAAVRIKVSNTYGDRPLVLGAAHIARRVAEANIDPTSDRSLTFHGRGSTTIPARGMAVSDPVNLDVASLSDLAVSLFFPETSDATTLHSLAQQTSYVSADTGDSTAAATFPVAKTIRSWPFLTGVDVQATSRGAAIVAFGSSLTDGDGTTRDSNGRFPDVLAARLQNHPGGRAVGVLNEGIIGNRLLAGSPGDAQFGALLGDAGLARFDRDVLRQAGVRYVIVGLGINDILFPGVFTPIADAVSADAIIAGLRQLIARAHRKGVRVIGTTNPPFEFATFNGKDLGIYTPEREAVRVQVNAWMLTTHEFDAVVDLDQVLRDPSRPTRLLPQYDSGDHLHPNNAGCIVEANAFPLALFERR